MTVIRCAAAIELQNVLAGNVAWGMPNMGAMSGARLVMPGPALDGRSVFELMRDEKVNAGARRTHRLADALATRRRRWTEAEGRIMPAPRDHRRFVGPASDERTLRDGLRCFRRSCLENDRDV